MISCVVLAAGSGKRMGGKKNKIFYALGKDSVLQKTVKQISKVSSISELVVVCAVEEREKIALELSNLNIPFPVIIAEGGKERQDSLVKGVEATSEEAEIIVTHDSARPFATPDLFEKVIQGAEQYGAATTAVPVKNTIKLIDETGCVVDTPQRSNLVAVQTPQATQKKLLQQALQYAQEINFLGTDDMSLVEKLGKTVKIVDGCYKNIKLTTPEDLILARQYIGVDKPMMRVGYGYDVHRFKEGRPCVLGGVYIESSIGPDGHSDGDVVIHALMDALLGAAGLRDIGFYFPPQDESLKDISSIVLLEKVMHLLKEKGFSPYNIDIMVIAEVPKINPHILEMKQVLETITLVPQDRISIKATTNEGLGSIGRREGISAQAVVTLWESEEEDNE